MDFKVILLCLSGFVVAMVAGHGILMDPINRSSMWRVGYDTPVNENDDALWCGGFDALWDENDGQCGICGDDYSEPDPRDNEVNGIYYSGIIVANYTAGQVINVSIQLTIQHYGYFEFRLCPNNDFTKESTQDCLDQHLLELADGSGTRYYIPIPTPHDAALTIPVKLPDDVTCFQCLFQWHWWTASNTGECPSGIEARGCGPQEVFRGCADVAIA